MDDHQTGIAPTGLVDLPVGAAQRPHVPATDKKKGCDDMTIISVGFN